jgi:hypothetical protein
MRDLLFKNLTSQNRRRKVIASRETLQQQGVQSIIQRHFIYTVKEIRAGEERLAVKPYAYLRKERNTRAQEEKFYCKIKGGVYTIFKNRVFLVLFMHSLKIHLFATPVCAKKI